MMHVHAIIYLFRDLIGLGLKMYVGSLISYFSTYLASLTVLIYLTTEEVAFFQIALARALLLAKFASASVTILYPRIAVLGERNSESRDLTVQSFRITLLVSLAAAAIGMVIAYPFVVLLYGFDYADVAFPLMILIPAVALQSSTSLMTSFFLALGKAWTTVGLSVVSLVPQVALLWIIVPHWGVPGAAAATAGAWVLASLVCLLVFSAITKAPISDLVRIRKDDARFVYGFGMSWVKANVPTIPRIAP
jgi:O-antigen/teichoic acid export membrane protein